MPEYSDYRSLMADGERAWHAGDEVLRYDFITSTPPSYYRSGAGWDIGGTSFGSFAGFAMDARERAMMAASIARWNEVATVNLVQGGGSNADIVIGSAEFQTGLYGFAYYPNADVLGRFGSHSGDIWVNAGFDQQNVPGVGPVTGHSSWYTYLHELGHALGLSHPNDRPDDPNSSAKYTVMSYVDHPSQFLENPRMAAFPLTPMVWDIQATQALYGANTETRNTATVYLGAGDGFASQAERAFQYGATNMQIRGEDGRLRDVILTIWDGGGTDLLDASDFTQDAHIDLRAGHYSSIGGVTDNVAVAAKVREDGRVVNFIEQAWGGDGDDWITGNPTGNKIRGGAGDDRIAGLAGRDKLFGDSGNDQIFGHKGRDRLHGKDGDDRLVGGQHQDTLNGGSGQDRLAGGGGSDLLRGQAGDDLLWGDNGNDRLYGGAGRDIVNGGNGNDVLTGGAGVDIFVFASGADQVLDFTRAEGDRIDLSRAAGITDFQGLTGSQGISGARMQATDTGVVIRDDAGNNMWLLDVDLSDLSADQFLF
ncbi:M10 family metallopeptidase C-terminal domain-containing protein [Epibacterium ulvae]|uniref:M10 family metallopeptidase C-terminal domain-containing protein n=1 Tax=Epibacterium ulvae TaxID=1156985 RepID=UPI001BFCA3DE|nr:M10 family metallopeptidase C-terminal domain-containing protein [Epibacterium ulvae]MBT8154540.1 M10 family metallopeptidase C-terminal domain-containing protein [Epibacterium ulvae]